MTMPTFKERDPWPPIPIDIHGDDPHEDLEGGGGYAEAIWSDHGLVFAGASPSRLYTSKPRVIIDVRFSLGGASSSGAVTYDINMDGSAAGDTIFTTSANRPTVAAAGFLSSTAIPDIVAWPVDSYLAVECDEAGTGATYPVVVVRYLEAA